MVKKIRGGEHYNKYIFLLFFSLIIFVAFLVIKPFINVLLTSMVIVYIFYPVFKRINKKIRNRAISAFIISLISIIVIIIPLVFVTNTIIFESIEFFNQIENVEFENLSNTLSSYLNTNSGDINFYLQDVVNKVVTFFIEIVSDIIVGIPGRILGLFVLLISLFYFFRDGDKLVEKVKGYLPIEEKNKDKLFDHIKSITSSMIYGTLLIAFVEAVLLEFAFYLFGINSAIFWGLITFILAILPAIGASFVWIPAGIIKLFGGNLGEGFGILLYGGILINFIELFLKPKLIGHKARIHPVLILIGAFGGLKLIGLIGVIVGPIILGIFSSILEFYKQEV